ncbi:MAG: sulfotransferase family protein [Desulfobacteraceae bacterium]|nr:sulfotransferase family protein [Desulfobacteraceae bacterium]
MRAYDLLNRLTYPYKLKGTSIYYWPVPKNACTTLKQAIYKFNYDKNFSSTNFFSKKYGIHDIYRSRSNLSKELDSNNRNFCIIRDPISRFVSLYTNRVLYYKELEICRNKIISVSLKVNPDINYFANNLEKYIKYSPEIKHHALPQVDYLGCNPEQYWRIYKISEIEQLSIEIKSITNKSLTINHYKKSDPGLKESTLLQLTNESIEYLREFYMKDYEIFGRYFD